MRRAVNLVLGVVVVLPVLAFVALGWWSGRAQSTAGGMVDGHLAPCGAAPHCVASESVAARDEVHATAPFDGAGGLSWAAIEAAVRARGGHLVTSRDGYLHATFTSRLFRFVDDLELRRDGERLQWRSASRVGYSDLGANRRRLEALRASLTAVADREK